MSLFRSKRDQADLQAGPDPASLFTVVLLFLLALIVRALTAGWGGLSCDEANCANIASAPTWERMVEYIKLDGNAPLFYVILRLWAIPFGSSDLSFRMLSVLAGASLSPLSYLLFRRQPGNGLALQIALMMALCAPLIQFGNLVRPYALLPVFSLVTTHLLMQLLERPARKGLVAAYGILVALMVYLHHWGAMVAVGHACLAATGLALRWWRPQQLLPWLAGAALALLLYLPWLPVLIWDLHHDVSPWIAPPTLSHLLMFTAVDTMSGPAGKMDWREAAVTLWANLAFWMSLVVPVEIEPATPGTPPFRSRRWQTVVGGGLLLAAITSQFRSLWRDRYLTAFTPLLLVLYAVTASKVCRRLPAKVAAVLPVALWLPIWLSHHFFFYTFPESSAWALMEQLSNQALPDTDLVVVSFEAIAPQVDRYLPASAPVVSFPDLERVKVIPWAGINERIRQRERLDKLLTMIEQRLASGGRIWLVESYHKYVPMPLRFPLDGLSFNAVEAVRMCQIRAWLEEHAVKDGKDLWAPGREFSIVASCFRRK